MGPGDLNRALRGLIQNKDPNIIAGFEGVEDAGVYKINDELAIVQTVDFFTPIVDDAYIFGQIAAANSLSDIYAMGATPLTAMNVVGFPIKEMSISILREILNGGLDKLREAGVTLIGGHSIEDNELKYGLSVTGVIHPERVVLNHGVKKGDDIILTKPLGTGIINTAIKGKKASPEVIEKVQAVMTELNREASLVMVEIGVNACTDVTGFGLLGHLCEMICNFDVGILIEMSHVPIIPKTEEFARMGLVPGGTNRNRKFREEMIEVVGQIPDYLMDVLFDPQTSGGLLISVSPEKTEDLLGKLHEKGIKDATIIGKAVERPKGKIVVKL